MKVDTYQHQEKLRGYSVSPLHAENNAGQYIAKGLSDLGVGIRHYKDRANDVATTEAMTRLKYAMNDKMYGEKGWINDKGKQALGLQQRGNEFFQKTMDELGADMDGEQRALFEQKARQYGLSVQQTLGGWEAQKIDAFTQETLQAEAQAALETATMSYGTKLYAQNIADYDLAIKKFTDYKGMSEEAAAQYLVKKRGEQTLAVVNNMLERNPDNPWAAKQFYESAKRAGRVDLETAQKIDNHLRPALDAATVRSLAVRFGAEIDAANVKENETNPDSPRDKSASVINRIMTDKSIPLRLRQHVAAAASARAKVAKAARDEEYSNTLSVVEEKMRSGLTPGEIPEFLMLKAKDQDELKEGVRKHSDPEVIFDFITNPDDLTVAKVKKNASKLTPSDRKTYLTQAVRLEEAKKKGSIEFQEALDKARGNERALEVALFDLGRGDKLKDPDFKKSEDWIYGNVLYDRLSRQWMKENQKTVVPFDVSRQLAHQAFRQVKEKGWIFDSNKSEAVLLEKSKGFAMRGEDAKYISLDGLILTDSKGKELKNSEALKNLIVEGFKRRRMTPTSATVLSIYREQEIINSANKNRQ